MSKRIIIAAGGTGGHLFPAQALATQILSKQPNSLIFFAGSGLDRNMFFEMEACAFKNVSSSTINLKRPLGLITGLYRIAKGVVSSIYLIKDFKPDLIIGFGSYHSLPVLIAAKLMKVPFVLHEGNAIPGKVNRIFSRWALFTAAYFKECLPCVEGSSYEVQMPLRKSLSHPPRDAEEAKNYFGLSGEKGVLTFLVFGGSQGASQLNDLILEAVEHLTDRISSFQVIHLTGSHANCFRIQSAYEQMGVPACVKPFESQMAYAWMAADLAICRAGAMTLAEQLEFAVPSILVPYPKATDRHQDKNASVMSLRIKGSIKIDSWQASAEAIEGAILELMDNDRALLSELKQNLLEHKKTPKPKQFIDLITEIPSSQTEEIES